MAQVQSQARKAAKLSTNPALDLREVGGSGPGRGGKGRGRGRGQAGRGRGGSNAEETEKEDRDNEDLDEEDAELEADMEMECFKKPAAKLKNASKAQSQPGGGKAEKGTRKKEKFRKHVILSYP